MICLIALPVFFVLGIFSMKYRILAKEAFDCIFRAITLRKCESKLDQRIKSRITGKILKYHPGTARFFFKNFELLSWIFVALFILSLIFSAIGIYNYAVYGNCNGPQSTGLCLLDPTGRYSGVSAEDVEMQSEIVYPVLEEDDPISGSKDAELTVIEFGCYGCPYTKRAEQTVREVIDYYEGRINFQFKTFYIPRHNLSYQAALAADCAIEQGKYPEYHKLLFDNQETMNLSSLTIFAEQSGMEKDEFEECFSAEKYKNEVEGDKLMGLHAGVQGTPTFFVNKQVIVGPKPFKTFRKIIDEELKK